MAPCSRLRARLRPEAGFTLIELMVGLALAMIIFFAAVNFIDVGTRSQAETGERVHALGQQRVGLERMTRELRQAQDVVTSTGAVDFILPEPGATADLQVRYDCTVENQCRRFEAPVGQTFPASYDPLVTDVESAAFDLQTIASAGDYVAIDLRVSLPDRDLPIALTDGVHLRNEAGA